MKRPTKSSLSDRSLKMKSDSEKASSCGRAKKRVLFSKTSILTLFEPHTKEEIRASWYDKNDIVHFKRTTKLSAFELRKSNADAVTKVVKLFAKGTDRSKISLQSDEEMLGLEHLVSERLGKLLLQRRKLKVLRVLKDQDMKRRLGRNDSSKKEVSAENSTCASNEAPVTDKEVINKVAGQVSPVGSKPNTPTNKPDVSIKHKGLSGVLTSKIASARAA